MEVQFIVSENEDGSTNAVEILVAFECEVAK